MEVKGDPKRAFKYYFPVLLPLLSFLGFSLYLKYEGDNCKELFGFPMPYLTFFAATYILSGALFILAVYQGYVGYKILKSKANPPPNMPVLFDTNVTFGLKDKLKGLALLVLYPAFGIVSLYFGNAIYTEVMGSRTLSEFRTEIRDDCKKTHNKHRQQEKPTLRYGFPLL